jgi:hypothetical protein
MTTSSGITRREALRRGLTVGGAALVWTAPSAQAFAMTTATGQAGSLNYGCTPGFWKNHADDDRAWCILEPGDTIESLFGDLGGFCDTGFGSLNDKTLLEALGWNGGDTLEDAVKNLLKHAVAFALNVSCFYKAASNVQTEVVGPVQDALSSCDRSTILELKDMFDRFNNRDCPWSNRDGFPT